MTSYYDAIGLLAICDAIDSVEGVPLSVLETLPNSQTPNDDAGPANESKPAAAALSPGGEAEAKENEYTLQPYPPRRSSVSGAALQALPAHRVPYNYLGASMDPAAVQTYPMFYAQPLIHTNLAHESLAGLDGVVGEDGGADALAVAAAATNAASASSSAYAHHLARAASFGNGSATPDLHGLRKKDLRSAAAVRKMSMDSASGGATGVFKASQQDHHRHTPRATRHHHHQSSPGSAGSPDRDDDGRPVVMYNGFKVEQCPICFRNFKGPKASTHKQQHIRRLHPEDYTPKRGGKKRLAPESPI